MSHPTLINEQVLEQTAERCRARGIIIPTFAQQRDPTRVPDGIRRRLRHLGLSEVHPLNLFRITWKNEAVEHGGGFGHGTWLEFPESLTGVPARIVGLVGRFFPTGAHKVGAAFGCLVPRLVSGQFNPVTQKAVWPSTGNYCRGGAFDCALLACTAVAILPEEMSRERFEWLRSIGAEVIATPGCESNVKEIYDQCWEIRRTRPECVIFNQFEEFGNAIWHYHLTGPFVEEVFTRLAAPRDRLAAYVSATGSGGTIAAGDYLRTRFPLLRVVATEALQCPTLLRCGFGGHRIEGIGDKHIPWIHNFRDTDAAVGVDDELPMRFIRLFNEPEGRKLLVEAGADPAAVAKLDWLGISGVGNLLAAIKFAKYYELGEDDIVFTMFTDSMAMYQSRLAELTAERGAYDQRQADRDYDRLQGVSVDYVFDMSHTDRRRAHNLKYFTWIEQLGKDLAELRAQWDDYRAYWGGLHAQVGALDALIEDFNAEILK